MCIEDTQIATPPTHPNNTIPADKRDLILENIKLYCDYIMLDNHPMSKVDALKTLLDNLNKQDNDNVVVKHYIDDRDITSEDVIKVVKEELVFLQLQEGS